MSYEMNFSKWGGPSVDDVPVGRIHLMPKRGPE